MKLDDNTKNSEELEKDFEKKIEVTYWPINQGKHLQKDLKVQQESNKGLTIEKKVSQGSQNSTQPQPKYEDGQVKKS